MLVDVKTCFVQGMQHQIAQVGLEIEAARLLVYNAARMKENGIPFVKQAALAKLFASQVCSSFWLFVNINSDFGLVVLQFFDIYLIDCKCIIALGGNNLYVSLRRMAWRCRFHEGIPGREVLSRRKDRFVLISFSSWTWCVRWPANQQTIEWTAWRRSGFCAIFFKFQNVAY